MDSLRIKIEKKLRTFLCILVMWLRNNLLERTSDLTKQRILRGSMQNTPENTAVRQKFQSSKGLKSSFWTGKFQFGGFSRIFRSSDKTSSFRKHGFCHGFHAEVIKPFVVGKQSVFNFTQRIFAGNLSKEQSQKQFPCGKMLAISVSA